MMRLPWTEPLRSLDQRNFAREEGWRWIAFAAVFALGWGGYAVLPTLLPGDPILSEIRAQIDFRLLSPLYNHTVYWLLSFEFIAVLTAVLVLQYFIPARPREKSFSSHFLADGIWFLYANVMRTFVMTTYVIWLTTLLAQHFSALHLTAMKSWPIGLRFLVAFLVIDFFAWLQHYGLHKISILWQFHAVHHSQTELSFFSDDRIHALEYPYRATIYAIPLAIFNIDTPAIVAYMIFTRWYSRIQHSNLRVNFGPLKYVVITPQAHRFHHVKDEQLRDRNFGRYLTVWDWLFGTMANSFDSYPATGIDDSAFPMEDKRPSIRLLWLPIVQQIYPFKVLMLRAWHRIHGRKSTPQITPPPGG